MMYAFVFTLGFMAGLTFVVVDTVGAVVLMEMDALHRENDNLKTELEMLKEKYGVKE